jgi:hypothetical protein
MKILLVWGIIIAVLLWGIVSSMLNSPLSSLLENLNQSNDCTMNLRRETFDLAREVRWDVRTRVTVGQNAHAQSRLSLITTPTLHKRIAITITVRRRSAQPASDTGTGHLTSSFVTCDVMCNRLLPGDASVLCCFWDFSCGSKLKSMSFRRHCWAINYQS